MMLNFKQLTFAREYRGYSQTELASRISGLSQSNLSKYEKGISTLSDELIRRIIEFLGFPDGFYSKSISNTVENPHYRKRININKKNVTDIESSIRLLGYIVDQMTDSLEWPDCNLDALNPEDGYSIETIAKHTRRSLGLKSGEPVQNINQALERHGIIIIEIDGIERFDGASLKTDNGHPLIVLNRNAPNDRKRFTIAHELGHLLLHVLGNYPIPDFRDEKVRECEAHHFASEFLMPGSEIKNSLFGLKLSALAELKKYWLTSMSSIIRRAYELGCIDKDRYTYLNIEMSRLGYKRVEPFDVFIDQPSLFIKGYEMYRNDLEYSDNDISEAFCLPLDVINRFCKPNSRSGKLRVVA